MERNDLYERGLLISRAFASNEDAAAACAAAIHGRTPGPSNPERLEDAVLVELALARDPRAVTALMTRMGPVLRRACASFLHDGDAIDECIAQLWSRLLVGRDGEPALASYTPSGSLAAWLRVVATREARRMAVKRAKERRRTDEFDEALDALVLEDPVIARMKEHYRAILRGAFRRAAASLDADDRTLLRAHTLENQTVESLATVHGVDKSTVSRWLSRARRTLAKRVRDEMQAETGVSDSEYESIVRLVQSRIDFSLSALRT